MIGYVAQTLLGGKTFTVRFAELNKRGVRAWLAMQLVGGAVTIAGDLQVRPGDTTEGADDLLAAVNAVESRMRRRESRRVS